MHTAATASPARREMRKKASIRCRSPEAKLYATSGIMARQMPTQMFSGRRSTFRMMPIAASSMSPWPEESLLMMMFVRS